MGFSQQFVRQFQRYLLKPKRRGRCRTASSRPEKRVCLHYITVASVHSDPQNGMSSVLAAAASAFWSGVRLAGLALVSMTGENLPTLTQTPPVFLGR